MLDRRIRRELGPSLYAALLDGEIELMLTWHDKTISAWWAYGRYRGKTLMRSARSAKAAAEALLAASKLESRPTGVLASLAALETAIHGLTVTLYGS